MHPRRLTANPRNAAASANSISCGLKLKAFNLEQVMVQKQQAGSRRQAHENQFMQAMRGISIAAVKKALRGRICGAEFYETSKSELAGRYATGKMSMNGSSEAQAFRKLDLGELGTDARRLHDSRPRKAIMRPMMS